MEISLQGQTVLYQNKKDDLIRTLKHIARAIRHARDNGMEIKLTYVWGDASPKPLFSNQEIMMIQSELGNDLQLKYVFFNQNTGTSLGHNQMADGCNKDYLWIMNPDIVVQIDFFYEIMQPFFQDTNEKSASLKRGKLQLNSGKDMILLQGRQVGEAERVRYSEQKFFLV